MGHTAVQPAEKAELRAELVARARALVPLLRQRAAEAEAARGVPRETFEAFREAGFLRIFLPERFGGYEFDPAVMVEIAAELGRGCASSAWVFTNLVIQSWINGMKPDAGQTDIWGDNPDALIASSFPGKDAKGTPTQGGWRLSGTWHFSSAIDFADWNHPQIFLRPEGGAPEHLYLAVPRSDYEVIDDWHMTALSATGSRSLRLNDVFVPAHRAISSRDVQGSTTPGSAVNPGPLYRMAYWGIAGKAFSAPALGVAAGMVEMMERDIAARASAGGASMAEMGAVQLRLAECGAEVDCARAVMLQDCIEAQRFAAAGETVPVLLRARWRRNNAYAAQLCVQAVERLYRLAGMRGMQPGAEIQRALKDVHAAACQIAIAWDMQATNYGRALFGLPLPDPRN